MSAAKKAREDDSGVSDPEDYCRCTYTAIRAQIPVTDWVSGATETVAVDVRLESTS